MTQTLFVGIFKFDDIEVNNLTSAISSIFAVCIEFCVNYTHERLANLVKCA